MDRGADANSRNRPLHTAAAFGDIASVKKLLEAGADLNAKDDMYHATARAHAQFWRQPEMVQFLTERWGTGKAPGMIE